MWVISAELGHTVFLGVWGNESLIIVNRVESGKNQPLLELSVGSVLPLLSSALGRNFLNHVPPPPDQPVQDELQLQAPWPTLRAPSCPRPRKTSKPWLRRPRLGLQPLPAHAAAAFHLAVDADLLSLGQHQRGADGDGVQLFAGCGIREAGVGVLKRYTGEISQVGVGALVGWDQVRCGEAGASSASWMRDKFLGQQWR